MQQDYSPEEMRRYWRTHSSLWSDLDREADPEGLTNVCFNGAPLWLNRFAAHCQRKTFLHLLKQAGPVTGLRALDVGCGVGRWSRLLTAMGARVTGIDLQPETLRDNMKRIPGCRFVEMSADALAFPSGSFDFATSVTVLQHMPWEIQDAALIEVRRVLVPGGLFLILEGTRDRGGHVFCHPAEDWREKAARAGFRLESSRPYDFAPLVYGLKNASQRYWETRGGREAGKVPVEEYVARFREGPEAGGSLRRLYRFLLRGATAASYPLEPLLVRVAPGAWAHHVGLVLRAV